MFIDLFWTSDRVHVAVLLLHGHEASFVVDPNGRPRFFYEPTLAIPNLLERFVSGRLDVDRELLDAAMEWIALQLDVHRLGDCRS